MYVYMCTVYYYYVYLVYYLHSSQYVTGFMKTGPNRARTEIHFIA